jgi:hypothetical protein
MDWCGEKLQTYQESAYEYWNNAHDFTALGVFYLKKFLICESLVRGCPVYIHQVSLAGPSRMPVAP